jgi:hypothetical protein
MAIAKNPTKVAVGMSVPLEGHPKVGAARGALMVDEIGPAQSPFPLVP